MYFVKYGSEYLHNPNGDDNNCMLANLSLEYEENSCGFCDFTIYPNHPLYNSLKAYGHKITVYDDDYLLFSGFIYELGKEFQLDGHVKCKGELAYLGMSIVRPHNLLFHSIGDYLSWLITRHNSQMGGGRSFALGNVPTDEKVLEIKSDDYTTTIDAINSNLIDIPDIGGHISVRHDGNTSYIDFELNHNSYNNTQTIDFGVNLLSYTSTYDFDEIATFVIPSGGTVEKTKVDEYGNEVTYSETVTLKTIDDKHITNDIVKQGDYVYSLNAVDTYGWIGKAYSNTNIEDPDILLGEAISVLNDVMTPNITIEIKAIDMHILNPELTPITVGDYVKVRSKPHNLDEYFLCTSINLDLNEPGNSEYIFGKKPYSFTSSYKKVASDSAKDAAEEAIEEYMEENGYAEEEQKNLKQIKVVTGETNIDKVIFVYETIKPEQYEDTGETEVPEKPTEPTEPTEPTDPSESETTITKDPYDCVYDGKDRIIKFGNIDILWGTAKELEETDDSLTTDVVIDNSTS